MLLGTKVPWSDSPEKRGGPCGVLLKAVLFMCLLSCRGSGILFGIVKMFDALGSLSSFDRPLSSALSAFLSRSVSGSWGNVHRPDDRSF